MIKSYSLLVFLLLSLVLKSQLIFENHPVFNNFSRTKEDSLGNINTEISLLDAQLICPENLVVDACKDQTTIDNFYALWLTSATYTTTCNSLLSNNSSSIPSYCGGKSVVTWTLVSNCADTMRCTAEFTVNASESITLNCPKGINVTDLNVPDIEIMFSEWKALASFTGGCNASLSNNGNGILVNGCNDVTFTVNSSCQEPVQCISSFMVGTSPPVVLTCPINKLEAPCQTQISIDEKYKAWLATVQVTGGCATRIVDDNADIPDHCGGKSTINFIAKSESEPDVACSSSFEVLSASSVVLTCPSSVTEAACQTQAAIDASFSAWKNTATFIGGCNGELSNNGSITPNSCGGTNNVTFIVNSDCDQAISCVSTFTITDEPASVLTCPANITELECQTQAQIDVKFNEWKNSASYTGGCNSVLSSGSSSAPNKCGGRTRLTFTLTNTCAPITTTCNATFSVNSPIEIQAKCPSSITETACQGQASIDSKFESWKASASYTGGCDGVLTNSIGTAPNKCGGTVTITFTVSSSCEPSSTCKATFTVSNESALVITCPANLTVPSCQSQSTIDTLFMNWKNSVSITGGCNGVITNSNGTAPNVCGGSTTITFTASSECEPPKTCNASFNVANAPRENLICQESKIESACQLQSTIDDSFTAWKNTVTFNGGCNTVLTNSTATAPDKCGGVTTITYTVSSDCSQQTTCKASFTVNEAPTVVITCPTSKTEPACQTQSSIDASFKEWKNNAAFSGGCNGVLTNSGAVAPDKCGGITTITFTVNSDCNQKETCNATFTVLNSSQVELTCPTSKTEPACQKQADINAAFLAWKSTSTFTGGCNAVLSSNGQAPNVCGGSVTVTFTATSTCERIITACTSLFMVEQAPKIKLTCPKDFKISSDLVTEIEVAYKKWLSEVSFEGGCNAVLINNGPAIPNFGKNEITFTVTSDCEEPLTCKAIFEVGGVNVKDVNSKNLILSIQANPVNHQLNVIIKGNHTGKFEFIITDLSGRQLYQSFEKKSKEELNIRKDVSQLAQGTYILSLISNKGKTSKKFIVIR